jgi:hypothetical protein
MEGYVDGAVFHNNPVRIANYESKLNFLDASRSDRRRFQIRKMINQVKPTQHDKLMAVPKAFPQIESWLTIFKKRVESALDAEATWREFRKDVVGTTPHAAAERYIRVNPRTKNRIPKMDDKSQIDNLQEEVINSLRTHGSQTKVKDIAQRLVASSFYFEKTSPSRPTDDHIIVQGMFSPTINITS